MLMVTTRTHAQRASKAATVLAGVNYLDMHSKYRLAGQKKLYLLQIWEELRYKTNAWEVFASAVHCCSRLLASEALSAALLDLVLMQLRFSYSSKAATASCASLCCPSDIIW